MAHTASFLPPQPGDNPPEKKADIFNSTCSGYEALCWWRTDVSYNVDASQERQKKVNNPTVFSNMPVFATVGCIKRTMDSDSALTPIGFWRMINPTNMAVFSDFERTKHWYPGVIDQEFNLLKNVGISPKYSVTLLCASQGQKLKPSSSPGILVSRAKGFKLKRHQPSEDNTVEKRREITIRCLIVYIGEKEEDLFKQYSDVEELNADLAMQVMKIAIIGDGPETIIVEESKILEGIDAARSCVLLMGVIYTLNLTYPKQLKFTFEVFQKLCLELDGQKASSKVTNLKLGIF
ncbi:uncharacterized protein [Nothobranchius furzeri]|uniref:uncharacterized protein n=1 Tax=Nothobranchius furzeri TaxID=105023 RepID=UPI003904B206